MVSAARRGGSAGAQGELSQHLITAAGRRQRSGVSVQPPARAQDVSCDMTLPSETIPSCNSHYSTCMHSNLCNAVSAGERPAGGKKNNDIFG